MGLLFGEGVGVPSGHGPCSVASPAAWACPPLPSTSPSSCIPTPQGTRGGNQGMEQSRAPRGPQHPTDGISQLGPVLSPCRNTQGAGGGLTEPQSPLRGSRRPGAELRRKPRPGEEVAPVPAVACAAPGGPLPAPGFDVISGSASPGLPPHPPSDTPGPRHSRQIWQGEEEPLTAPSKWRRPFKAIPAWPGTRGDTRTCARSRLPLCVHTRVRRGCSRQLCRAAAPTRVQAAALLAAPRIPHASGPARGGSSFWPPPRGLVPAH